MKETKILIYFLGIRECVFGTSFLLTLDIYKAYFRGRHIRDNKREHMQKVIDALFSLKEAIASFVPYDFITKCFLIFIVDEVKNFVANILLSQVGE